MSIGSSSISNQNNHSGAVNPSNVAATRVAPHLRISPGNIAPRMVIPRQVSDSKTVSSASNPYDGGRAETTSQSGWSAIGPRHRPAVPAPIIYNAWDASGVAHVQRRFPSDSYSDTGSTITTTTTSTARPAPAPTTARNSNWAKPVGTKKKNNEYNALDHQANPRRPQNDDDSDYDSM